MENLQLPKAKEILKQSWVIYKLKFKTLIYISLIPLALIAFLVGIGVLGAVFGKLIKFNFNEYGFIALIIYGLIVAICTIYVYIWGAVAQIYAIRDSNEKITWRESFTLSQNKISAFFGTNLLAGLATLGGFILFIIPGFIFGLWFSQSGYLVIDEDLAGTKALKRSKELIKGRFWQVLGKYFYIGIISVVLYIIISIISGILIPIKDPEMHRPSILLNIFSFFWTPLTLIYSFQLFKHLKETRP